MTSTHRACIAATIALALLAGCTGGSSPVPTIGSAVQRAPSASKAVSSRKHRVKAKLTIHIRIPRHRRHRYHHGARFISAATQGVTLTFSGPSTLNEAVGVTPGTNPNCTGPSGGPYSCTIAVQLLSGNYTASISTYDAVSGCPSSCTIPGSANLLSRARNVPFTMTGGITNNVNFTLEGVPASLTVSGLPSGTAGTAFSSAQAFTVTAKDADGYTIVGTYDNPITLADSDVSGATTIATSGSDSPPAGELLGSGDSATLNYTGLAIAPATITASAGGATNGTGTFTPTLQPIVYSGPQSGSTPEISYGGTLSFSASEAGWTNAPYNKTLTATAASNCSALGSVSPSSGTSFSISFATSPMVGGSCTVTVADSFSQSLPVTVTAPAIGTPTSIGSNTATGTSSTTLHVTTTATVPAGGSIIVAAYNFSLSAPPSSATCSDGSNAYSTNVTHGDGLSDLLILCSATRIASPLASGSTITVTWSGGSSPFDQFIRAWSVTGLDASAFDQSATATSFGATPSSGAASTTAQANELLFAAITTQSRPVATAGFSPGTNGTSNTCAASTSSTYTSLGGLDLSGSAPSMFAQYCVVDAIAGYAANATLGFSSSQWDALLATFKGITP